MALSCTLQPALKEILEYGGTSKPSPCAERSGTPPPRLRGQGLCFRVRGNVWGDYRSGGLSLFFPFVGNAQTRAATMGTGPGGVARGLWINGRHSSRGQQGQMWRGLRSTANTFNLFPGRWGTEQPAFKCKSYFTSASSKTGRRLAGLGAIWALLSAAENIFLYRILMCVKAMKL